jgi:hypothetical protein
VALIRVAPQAHRCGQCGHGRGASYTCLVAYQHQNKKGQTYYLHGKQVTLQNGRKQQIYYFAREEKPGEALAALPAGYRIEENERTGLPFLKKA